MAIPLDPNQIVSFEELLMSQVVQQEALTRLLVEKGIFTKMEFLEMVKVVDREMKMEKRAKENQGKIAFERDELLVLYKENESRIKSHRETLWKQVRHFSWLITIVLSASGYILIKSKEFEIIAWIVPFLMLLSIGVGFLALTIINQERREFLRAVIVTRKIEKLLGLHKPLENSDLSQQKGISGYLFSQAHIDVFKKIEELWANSDKKRNGEQLWIQWRMKKRFSPFDNFRYLFMGQIGISLLGLIYSIDFLFLNFRFYLPPLTK
jgi:hypothetical protein